MAVNSSSDMYDRDKSTNGYCSIFLIFNLLQYMSRSFSGYFRNCKKGKRITVMGTRELKGKRDVKSSDIAGCFDRNLIGPVRAISTLSVSR